MSAPIGKLGVTPTPRVETDPATKRASDAATVGREFEAMFVRTLLRATPMGNRGDAYGDMALEGLASSVTAGRGIGLGQLIQRSLDQSSMGAHAPAEKKEPKP